MRRRSAIAFTAAGFLLIMLIVGLGPTQKVNAQDSGTTLFSGWNMVVYQGTTLDVESALNNVLNDVESVWQWQATAQTWLSWRLGGLSFLQTLADLTNGQAYWLRSTVETEWIFNTASRTVDAGDGVPEAVASEFNDANALFAVATTGPGLVVRSVSAATDAGTTTAEMIDFLLANSQIVGEGADGTFEAVAIGAQDAETQAAFRTRVAETIGDRAVTPYLLEWMLGTTPVTSVALFDSETNELLYDPVAVPTKVTRDQTATAEVEDAGLTANQGSPAIAQGHIPLSGDLYNYWGENIFGWSLVTIQVSNGLFQCVQLTDQYGNPAGWRYVPVTGDQNILIQVQIQTAWGWTADAVVTSVVAAVDRVTFQTTVVAAGPLATVNVGVDKSGFKSSLGVTGPVGTFKKTFNTTRICPDG